MSSAHNFRAWCLFKIKINRIQAALAHYTAKGKEKQKKKSHLGNFPQQQNQTPLEQVQQFGTSSDTKTQEQPSLECLLN